MSLMSEIAALREEIDRKVRPQAETGPEPPPRPGEEAGENGIDTLLAAVNNVVEELGKDIDKFPRITAITAFGIGLAIGFALARQVR